MSVNGTNGGQGRTAEDVGVDVAAVVLVGAVCAVGLVVLALGWLTFIAALGLLGTWHAARWAISAYGAAQYRRGHATACDTMADQLRKVKRVDARG